MGLLKPLIFSQGRRALAAVPLWVTRALVPIGMHPILGHAYDTADDDLPALSSMREPSPKTNVLTSGSFICYKGGLEQPRRLALSIVSRARGTPLAGRGHRRSSGGAGTKRAL
jgi:hypothetical protein